MTMMKLLECKELMAKSINFFLSLLTNDTPLSNENDVIKQIAYRIIVVYIAIIINNKANAIVTIRLFSIRTHTHPHIYFQSYS